MSNHTSDIVMIIVYWALSVWWIIVLAIAVSYLMWRPLYRAPQPRRIMYGFLVLAILFLADSLYWSLANTARVGVLPNSARLLSLLYASSLIATIKAAFLVAGIIFLVIVAMTYRQLEERMETLYFTRYAEGIVDAIGVLNPRGVVVYWNKGAETLYEQPRSRVLGSPIKKFLVPKRLHKHIDEILKMIRRTNQPQRFIAPRLKADGSEILVDITITPFTYANDKFGGYFGLMRPAAQPELEIPPKIEDAVEQPAEPRSDAESDEAIHKIISKMVVDERRFQNRLNFAAAVAIVLLLATAVLLLVTFLVDSQHKLIFGPSSILTLLLEILPLRFLVKNRTVNFSARAIERILDLSGTDPERNSRALQILDAMNRSQGADSSQDSA